MCQRWLRSDDRVGKRGVQTDRQRGTAALVEGNLGEPLLQTCASSALECVALCNVNESVVRSA